MEASEALKAETEAILTEGGALSAHVTQEGEFWTVSAAFACRGYAEDGQNGFSGAYGPKPYTGNTRRTGGDPRDLALHFVADAAEHRAKMDAFFAPPVAEEPDEDEQEGLELGAELLEDEGDGAAAFDRDPEAQSGWQRDMGVSTGGSDEDEAWRHDAPGAGESGAERGGTLEGGGDPIDATYDELTAPDTDALADPYDINYETDRLTLIEGAPDDVPVEHPKPTDPGGVAYFGDNIHTIKLAKLGRLSQIARAAKEALQEGWTTEEFAEVQNYILSNTDDIGTFIGAQERYERFIWIADRQRAQSRIEVYREAREAELEAADRDGIEAFDPETNWPE